LTDDDIDRLLKDLERKYPTSEGLLTDEEEITYKGSIRNKIRREYWGNPMKMSVDMAAL
jgi:hypothetical protein